MISDSDKFPDFLIVGAAKSGTTSLHQYLGESQEVFLPKRKELNFWYTDGKKDWAIMNRFPELPKTIEEYTAHFLDAKENQIKGEASPGYMVYHEETIKNLKKYHPNWKDVKILILLREPVSKIWSHYQMVKRGKMDPDGYNLLKALNNEKFRINKKNLVDINYIFNTSYYSQVSAFLNEFNNVKIILFENLVNKPQDTLNEIADFLEIQRFTPKNLNKKFNEAKRNRIGVKGKRTFIKNIGSIFPKSLKQIIVNLLSFKKKEKISNKELGFIQLALKDDLIALNKIIEPDISHWYENY